MIISDGLVLHPRKLGRILRTQKAVLKYFKIAPMYIFIEEFNPSLSRWFFPYIHSIWGQIFVSMSAPSTIPVRTMITSYLFLHLLHLLRGPQKLFTE